MFCHCSKRIFILQAADLFELQSDPQKYSMLEMKEQIVLQHLDEDLPIES